MEKPNILSQEEIEAGLKDLPGWKFENDKISKQYEFKDFMDSLGFIEKMAPIFEENDHHPDTKIMYSKVLFELQRFDIGGKVTDRDLFMAGEIEKHYQNRN
jgi:4a-hydroxytetrahydrobiopterin dehydratase